MKTVECVSHTLRLMLVVLLPVVFPIQWLFASTIVASVLPAKFALNVSSTTTIQITFSAAVLPGSFNDTTAFLVCGVISGQHRGAVTLSAENTLATFVPTIPFIKGENVVVEVTTHIRDADGFSITPFTYTFTVRVNPSFGNFAEGLSSGVGKSPNNAVVVDVDRDGWPDIVVTNYDDATVSILRNKGDGTFLSDVKYPVATDPTAICVGDVDGDGYGDIVVTNWHDTLSVLTNNGDGTFGTKVDYSTGSIPNSVFIADVDLDGYADLVVSNQNGRSISVFLNNRDGTFANRVDYAARDFPTSAVVVDVDGDGYGDIVVANRNDFTVSVFKNNKDGSFSDQVTYPTGSGAISVSVGDLNGDGFCDLLTANVNANTVSVLMNNGDGTFAGKVDYPTLIQPRAAIAADVDGDDDLDIIVYNYLWSNTGPSFGGVSVLKNYGNGSFGQTVNYKTTFNSTGFAIGDVDSDGKVEIFIIKTPFGVVTPLKSVQMCALTAHAKNGIILQNPSQNLYTPGAHVTLTATANPTHYFCSWDGDTCTTNNPITVTVNRNLEITASFGDSTILAVELVSFQAVSFVNAVRLTWRTATETGNCGFEVQRSMDGAWQKVGFVPGVGTSSTPRDYAFIDENISGRVSYRLKQVDRDGTVKYSGVADIVAGIAPRVLELAQNFPNPFNPETNVQFTVPNDGRAKLRVCNMLGQTVATLYDNFVIAGIYHNVKFYGSNLAGGIYLLRLEYNGKVDTRKMVLLK